MTHTRQTTRTKRTTTGTMTGTLALALAATGAVALSPPAPAQAGEAVVYEVDGTAYEGYFAPAEGASKGLVMVIHDWDGLDDYERGRADMLAARGYDAFAADLFGQGNRPETVDDRRAATGALRDDRAKMRAIMMGALEAARERSDQPAVVMGYCFGGGAALELARSGAAGNVAGYATFHGSLGTPEGQSYPADTPPVLVLHGGADTSVTMEDVTALTGELEAAGITYEIEIYSGAPHAFTVEGSDRYQARADEKSWAAFEEFLGTTLGG